MNTLPTVNRIPKLLNSVCKRIQCVVGMTGATRLLAGFRAIVFFAFCGSCLADSIARLPLTEASDSATDRMSDDVVWWEELLASPMIRGRESVPLTINQSLLTALDNAPELRVLHNDIEVLRAEIVRQGAAFDWSTFLETVWNRDSSPVGSVLDGAADRLRSRSWTYSGGVRRRSRVGGQLRIAQDHGFLNSNSQFITPNNQGTSRLALRYEQPLLRGRGRQYNESGMELASIQRDVSYDELQIGIQDYLLEVAESYWALVMARGQFALRIRSWKLADKIAAHMQDRTAVDVRPRQLNRVHSEVTSREASAADARYAILRAQERLLRNVYGPDFARYAQHQEILTSSVPRRDSLLADLDAEVESGLQNRVEIHQAMKRIRFACAQQQIAKHEVLPSLNFILTGYVSGLRGDADIGNAFVDQFREGEPGVGTGINFEYPLGNRAAQATLRQRRLAIARTQEEMQTAIAQVTLDVREQATENNKFAEVLDIRLSALRLAVVDMQYLATRQQYLIDGNRVADLYLEDMLQSQIRLVNAELQFLESQVGAMFARAALDRASGRLAANGQACHLSHGQCEPEPPTIQR